MFSVWQLPIKTKWTQINKCCPFWSSLSSITIVLILKQSNLSWNTCNLKRIFKLKSRKSAFWNLDKTLTLVPNGLHLKFSAHLSFILNSPGFFFVRFTLSDLYKPLGLTLYKSISTQHSNYLSRPWLSRTFLASGYSSKAYNNKQIVPTY